MHRLVWSVDKIGSRSYSGQRFRIVSNVLLEAFELSGTSDNVIKGFRMPHATT